MNLIIRVTGTKDWQCKAMVFKTIFDFEDYCTKAAPTKTKSINDYIDLKDLCSIMSDCFVTYSYEWH